MHHRSILATLTLAAGVLTAGNAAARTAPLRGAGRGAIVGVGPHRGASASRERARAPCPAASRTERTAT